MTNICCEKYKVFTSMRQINVTVKKECFKEGERIRNLMNNIEYNNSLVKTKYLILKDSTMTHQQSAIQVEQSILSHLHLESFIIILIKSMNIPNHFEEVDKKRNYSKIPIKKRMLLVKLVLKKGVPIAQVIEELGLKITTARFIINKYKETGTFPRRKFKKRGSNFHRIKKCKKEENLSSASNQESNAQQNNQVKIEQGESKIQQVVDSHVIKKQEEMGNNTYFMYYPWAMV